MYTGTVWFVSDLVGTKIVGFVSGSFYFEPFQNYNGRYGARGVSVRQSVKMEWVTGCRREHGTRRARPYRGHLRRPNRDLVTLYNAGNLSSIIHIYYLTVMKAQGEFHIDLRMFAANI